MRTTRRLRVPAAQRNPPPSASRRGYLRNGMPAFYQEEGSFGMRFLTALEEVLDPVVTLLDSLPRTFEPAQAPDDVLDLIAAWIGAEHHESFPAARRRELIAHTTVISAWRGTRRGLELALRLNFPDLPLRVEDNGRVLIDDALPIADARHPGFIVYCDTPLPEGEQRELARLIDREKPAHVRYKLRVKTKRSHEGAE
jgi:phage tail-like protein